MYQALYRQYRPRTFDELVGQEHITTTLKNQIKRNNIGHAYLFAGTKGTGKTSTAKIFSRAVNCLKPVEGNPCNECEICRGILNESIMDIVEMDAASNRRIEDIRELKDKVVYPPSKGRYRVYIVDEVHMLTDPAFNALLKTLEEPPKHLIFILATTAMEKLPQTILSRCQIFNFRRITNRDMVANMEGICKKLQVPAEKTALALIARNSAGSMRDALSLLDQCISYVDKELTYKDTLEILGITNVDLLFAMVDSILDKDLENILYRIDEIVQDGKDINQFIKDLIYHYRNLLVLKASKNSADILDMDSESITRYVKQGEKITIEGILKSIDILNQCESQARQASQPRIMLEMAIIRLGDIWGGDKENSKAPIRKTDPKIEKPVPEKVIEKPKAKAARRAKVDDEGMTLPHIRREWEKILAIVREKNIRVHAFLKEGELSSLKGKTLSIGYKSKYEFHRNAMEKLSNKELVEEIISSHFGKNISLDFIIDNSDREGLGQDEDSIIQEVIDFFGEDLVEIEE